MLPRPVSGYFAAERDPVRIIMHIVAGHGYTYAMPGLWCRHICPHAAGRVVKLDRDKIRRRVLVTCEVAPLCLLSLCAIALLAPDVGGTARSLMLGALALGATVFACCVVWALVYVSRQDTRSRTWRRWWSVALWFGSAVALPVFGFMELRASRVTEDGQSP